jgi:Peptidase family S41
VSPSRSISGPAGTPAEGVALDEFLAGVAPLAIADRYRLVDQASALLEGLYVHLPLKRAMHAIDPIQRLRLLAHRLESLSELQFHAELAAIFRSLRDLHTVYQLPVPYRGHVATLGFLVERYHDEDGAARHLVTKIDPALEHAGLTAGAELVAWNGVPIERAVEINADRAAGSNLDARLARGLEALTLRPLRNGPPPDEHWVLLGYRSPRGRRGETRIPWRVMTAETLAGRAKDPVSTISAVLGIDAGNEASRQVKRALFAPRRAAGAAARALRSVVEARPRRIAGNQVGHLRIYSFNVSGARLFAEQIAALAAELPRGGLIVDIRGNPGGNIPAAEAALALLSKRPVTPVSFSLATTPGALELSRRNPGFGRWADSIGAAVETGETYSQGFPLSDPAEITAGLPRYPGPKVLITDALSYSAADIFAAGWQDNRLGPILGTVPHTGAGGANVWTHELLRLWMPDTLGPLPAGADFRVALRRVTRVNDRVGVPLEDLGVRADSLHPLSRRDITEDNQDLLAAAASLLSA